MFEGQLEHRFSPHPKSSARTNLRFPAMYSFFHKNRHNDARRAPSFPPPATLAAGRVAPFDHGFFSLVRVASESEAAVGAGDGGLGRVRRDPEDVVEVDPGGVVGHLAAKLEENQNNGYFLLMEGSHGTMSWDEVMGRSHRSDEGLVKQNNVFSLSGIITRC